VYSCESKDSVRNTSFTKGESSLNFYGLLNPALTVMMEGGNPEKLAHKFHRSRDRVLGAFKLNFPSILSPPLEVMDDV
jgi:hypothetical protein